MASQRSLKSRVEDAAEAVLRRQKVVTPLDVYIGIGWLSESHVSQWRHGRVASLDSFRPVEPDRYASVLEYLGDWAAGRGLVASEGSYLGATRDRRSLRFTSDGDPSLERAWRTQWIASDLSPAQASRVAQRQAKAPDLVVVIPVKDWTCAECGGTGDFLIMDDTGPLCMTCADMDHLVFLPSGDAALSRRAKKASRLSAVVVRWSRTRKRYERQGVLVEEAALESAEEQCLADEDARMRRRERDAGRRAEQDVKFQAAFAAAIRRLYPRCPAARAEAIAAHAALRGSGRVGRSAAARELDERAITLAVVASVRHHDTPYDDLLMSGVPRAQARETISEDIDRVLSEWSRAR
jgi:hypothetical protein